jgi:putative NADPH-quinone reductase
LGARLRRHVLEVLAARGAEVRLHDLLEDGFDPVLRLADDAPHAAECDPAQDPLTARYQEDVRWAEVLVVLHPVWWFAPPAILKGWIDRVLVHEVALRQRAGGAPLPLLDGRRALIVQTFNTKRAVDRALFLGFTGAFWKRVVFASVGITSVNRLALYEVERLDEPRLTRFEARLARAVELLLR